MGVATFLCWPPLKGRCLANTTSCGVTTLQKPTLDRRRRGYPQLVVGGFRVLLNSWSDKKAQAVGLSGFVENVLKKGHDLVVFPGLEVYSLG
jgi:hypothetical protein